MADWSHQERAVQAIDQAIADGHKKICLASPTGSGKSRILFEHLCRHEMKTVVHTDRIMLKDQLSTEMEKHDISHALQASGHDTEYARIQLAMVQTLVSRYLKQGRPLHDAQIVYWDEVHKNCGDTTLQLRDSYGDVIDIGITATPLGIGHVYKHMIVAAKNSELREAGVLVPALHYGPNEPDTKWIGKVIVDDGECGIPNAKRMEYTTRVFGSVVDNMREINPQEKPTILFAPGVRESVWFAQELTKHEIPAAHIDGQNVWLDGEEMPRTQELVEDIRDRLQSGELSVVSNRFCLDDQTEILTSEGWVSKDEMTYSHQVANWKDGAIFFSEPKSIVRRGRYADEKMVVLETPRRSIRVTENHRMLFRPRNGSDFSVFEAGELVGREGELPVWGESESFHQMTTFRLKYEAGRKDEQVWCVENESGNIITRRKGSVTVMGNCLREGIDWPFVEHAIFATIFGSLTSYLQAGGRLLRVHPSKSVSTIQDHGGNWWRHGSLNADRHWDLELTNRIASGLREMNIRAKKEPEPYQCPKCFAIRLGGAKCWDCGFMGTRRSRQVLQKNGSLREMPGEIFKARRTAKPTKSARDSWSARVSAVRGSKRKSVQSMSFAQLAATWARENNWYWPPREFPMMPKHDYDWFRRVRDVPLERLNEG